MDGYNDSRSRESGPGMIEKAAHLAPQEVTEEELKAINKFALEPLTAEDVFTFKLALCDNEVDRDFERFSLKALDGLRKLFLGKTGIKDHRWSADNQVARIFATEIVQHPEKTTKSGEPYAQLVAYCYMVKTSSNADLIAEIKGGIKKEVSVGCSVSRCSCTICGKSYGTCGHRKGESYPKGGTVKEVCTAVLDDPVDAYEFSFVAVPAQRNAGASKTSTGAAGPQETPETSETETPETNTENAEKAAKLALRARVAAIRATHTN